MELINIDYKEFKAEIYQKYIEIFPEEERKTLEAMEKNYNKNITKFIKIDEENELIMTGNIKGSMTLQDDITLEPVEYEFDSELDEILDKDKTELNLIDVSWQNILVEIPSKVRSTNEDIELSGDGWRVISEEKYQEERNTANNPFANLKNLINAKEEK